MKIKKYTGESIQDVIFQVKADLGPEAVIVEKRKMKKGGIFGFFGKTVFEVVAALEEQKTADPNPQSKNAIKEFIDDIQKTEIAEKRGKEVAEEESAEKKKAGFKKALENYQKQQSDASKEDAVQDQMINSRVFNDQLENTEDKAEIRNGAQQSQKNADKQKSNAAANHNNQQSENLKQKIKIKMDSSGRERNKQINITQNGDVNGDNQLYNFLLEQGVDSRILNLFIKKINQDKAALAADNYKDRLKIFFENYFASGSEIKLDAEKKVVAFIGPTGVGKTTTMAKVAAEFTLERDKNVGLMTADTYRIAAVEQLRTYSNIIDIPFAVCYNSSKIEDMINKQFADCDLVLIDTPGSSWKNNVQIDQLKAYTDDSIVDEVHLLLSLNTKSSDLENIINRFDSLKPDKIILTKLDETTTYGDIINIKENYKLPYSYLTDGQDVPDDISTAEAKNLFDYIFGDLYD